METITFRKLETVRQARDFIKRLNNWPREAKERGQKSAWIMAWPAYPILYTFDIAYSATENYAALSAAKKIAQPYLVKAESEGYSHTICGYIRNTLGYVCMVKELGTIPPDAPDGGLVKPDMFIAPSNSCDLRIKHYQDLARYWDIPVYGYDFIFPQYEADEEEIENCVKYNAEEYNGLIAFLEQQTGKKMDWDKFAQFLQLDYQTRKLYRAIYDLRKAIPGPMATRDAITAMVPYYWFPCDKAAVEFYSKLYQEVKDRVDKGIGALSQEKYRIFWFGLPPWHTLTLYNYLDSQGAACIIDNIYHPFQIPEDRKDPLEALANRMLRTGWGDESGMYFPLNYMQRVIEEYKVDGIVVHQVLGCRQVTVGAKTCIQQLEREYKKIPVLYIPGELIDLRDYSDADTKRNIDEFVETVATYKEATAKLS